MENRVKKQLIKDGWKEGQRLLLAVSGGVDSMFMWSLIHNLGIDYGIAHVNFKLRGVESDDDEKLVKRIAKARNIPFYQLEKNTKEIADEKSISIQMAAREIRYAWFDELMEAHNFDFLCTAHHLDDSIETFFINLDRGTGIKGLTGINSNEKVLRPLQNFSKEEIKNIAKKEELLFREDKSNSDVKYQRNWFRNELIASWKSRNGSFEKTMQKNLERLNQVSLVYKKAIDKDLKNIREELVADRFKILSYTKLEYGSESQFELLSGYGFNESQIENLNTSIKNQQVGLILKSKTFKINLDRREVFLKTIEKDESEELLIFKYQNSIDIPIKLDFEIIKKEEVIFDQTSKIEFFDLDKLQFPLRLRKWERGDKMKPIGMKGQKKISDILVDLKVPMIDKSECWVLESNQKIVWLIGYKVSEEFKVDNNTAQVLRIK
jgi:tRNA(Ile)-lysidine synthase